MALAKTLHHYMGVAIEAFEKQEGTIAIPKTIEAALAAASDAVKK